MSDQPPPSKNEIDDDFPDDADFPDSDFIDEEIDDEEDDFPETPPSHTLSKDEIQQALGDEDSTSEHTPPVEDTDTTPPPSNEEQPPSPPATTTTPIEEEATTSLEDIPFPIHIEVARIQMNYQDLCDIQNGQVLDLHTQPINHVHLTLNGKTIGKGELIKIGETLGVRILEIS